MDGPTGGGPDGFSVPGGGLPNGMQGPGQGTDGVMPPPSEITIGGKTFKVIGAVPLALMPCQCPECLAKAQAAYSAAKSLLVKAPPRRWLFGLVREADIAAPLPRGFGRAWHRPEQLEQVVAIVPLNWLLGKVRNTWQALRRGPQQRDLRLIDDVATGLAQTRGQGLRRLGRLRRARQAPPADL